jgi:hypothetical protein
MLSGHKRGRSLSRVRSSQSQTQRRSRSNSRDPASIPGAFSTRGFQPRRSIPRTIAGRVKQLESQAEKKYLQFGYGPFNVTNGAGVGSNLALLNGLVRGDTVQQRDGDKVRLLKGHLKGLIYSSTAESDNQKVFVLLDKQANKTQLTYNNILGTNTPIITTLWNFNNINFWDRFEILAELVIHTDPIPISGSSATTPQVFSSQESYFELSWDCKDYFANYQGGTAGTIADITQGALYFGMINASNTASSASCYFNGVQYFKDS